MSDPQPPYPCPLPKAFADMPYDRLPPALRARVDAAVAEQASPPPAPEGTP